MGMDVEEEEEALFGYSSPPLPPPYFVQSPSTTTSNASTFEFQIAKTKPSPQPELASGRTTFSSSRCSSTRESLMSNKLALVEIGSGLHRGRKSSVVAGKHDEDVDDDDSKIGIVRHFGSTHDDYEKGEYGGRSVGLRKYLSFGTYDGSMWLALQLSWRFMVSLAAALLVFYIATKPPPPQISVKVGAVREFELAEGVDGSGVSTKIMRCNASIEVLVDNNSKVFELHLLPPALQMSFQHLTFAASQGDPMVAEREQLTRLEMYLGTRSKPMYGAGRVMQDMLDSGGGLPLLVEVRLVSNYRVVGGIIQPWFHHHARCLLVITKVYDTKRRTHHFNNTCAVFSSD